MDKQISFNLIKLKLEVGLPHSHMSSHDGYKTLAWHHCFLMMAVNDLPELHSLLHGKQ